MTFYEIEFPVAALSVESVETALEELGASSITFVDRGDEPVLEPKPGEFRLWSDTRIGMTRNCISRVFQPIV